MDTIRSVSEYLECLSKIKMEPKTTFSVGCFTLFRGQANANWLLSPSLYRQNLFEAENLLLTEIKHICPNEFGDNRFDSLVKMQHFGMPTRLLDVTTNPLVSLYFACETSEQSNEDGIVYIFPNMPVSWSNDPLVDLVMDFVYDYFPRKMWLDQMLDQSQKKYRNGSYRLMPDTIDSLLHYLTVPAFAVMPAKTNERIEAQDGAFFVFGMHFSNREVSTNPGTIGRVYYNFEPIEIDNVQQIWKKTETLRIPAAAKKGILNQLDILGINERKLFPDLSHQINHTVRTVKAHMIK